MTSRSDVIQYLNKLTGRQFKPDSKESKGFDKVLEQYSLEQVKKVIDFKVDEWGEDEKMSKHLRPSTFVRHFDKYFDQANHVRIIPKRTENQRREYLDFFAVPHHRTGNEE